VALVGLPDEDGRGRSFRETIEVAAANTLEGLPKARRKDIAMVRDAVKRAVRGAVNERWGKKPIVEVMISVV